MIIHVKPDKNGNPTYVYENKKNKKSIGQQIITGIKTAFKIVFTFTLSIIALIIILYISLSL